MPVIWSETTPRFFYLTSGGFIDVTITSKIPNMAKPFRQNTLYQVLPDPSGLTGVTTIPSDPTDIYRAEASLLRGTGNADEFLSEFSDTSPIIVVPAIQLSDFLNNQLIIPQRSIQVSGVVYKKITLKFYGPKSLTGVRGPTGLEGLREYGLVHLTLPASVSGDIDSSQPAVVGALSINQYAAAPVSRAAGSSKRIQQDRPGRYLIRGCGISEAQALSDSRVSTLLTNLQNGGRLSATVQTGLTPVINILGDIWTVRATQSAGYVRVAAQAGINPKSTVRPEGGQ